MSVSLDILSNNGTVGGGEVMMTALAEAVRLAGVPVRVVVPREPSGAADLARSRGLDVIEIPARDRLGYLEGLARYRRRLTGTVWWCNGLVPALATAGTRHRRVVQLHQVPAGYQRRLWQVARPGVERVFVPSMSMQSSIPGSTALLNWTDDPGPPRAPSASEDGRVRIGFIGRFSPIKGLHVLARSVQRLERDLDVPVELVLAGDGRFVPEAHRTVVEMELARVRCVRRLGWVDRATFFDSVDVVVAPSVWAEPFGLVAAEAMAFGRPVVISDAGALDEVVGSGHPWVARAGDATDTARVIQRFLETDPEDLAAWLVIARRRWEAEFSPAAGASRVAGVLAELGLTAKPEVLDRSGEARGLR